MVDQRDAALRPHLGQDRGEPLVRTVEVPAASARARRVDVQRQVAPGVGHLLAGDDHETGPREDVELRRVEAKVVLGHRDELVAVIAVPPDHVPQGRGAVAARRVRVDVAALEAVRAHRVAEVGVLARDAAHGGADMAPERGRARAPDDDGDEDGERTGHEGHAGRQRATRQ